MRQCPHSSSRAISATHRHAPAAAPSRGAAAAAARLHPWAVFAADGGNRKPKKKEKKEKKEKKGKKGKMMDGKMEDGMGKNEWALI